MVPSMRMGPSDRTPVVERDEVTETDKDPSKANYRIWWKQKRKSDRDAFDGHTVIVGIQNATRFQGEKISELGDKYNVGMFRISDEWGVASPDSQET